MKLYTVLITKIMFLHCFCYFQNHGTHELKRRSLKSRKWNIMHWRLCKKHSDGLTTNKGKMFIIICKKHISSTFYEFLGSLKFCIQVSYNSKFQENFQVFLLRNSLLYILLSIACLRNDRANYLLLHFSDKLDTVKPLLKRALLKVY